MLKKIFSAVLMLGVILSTSVAMAEYPKYLNGDNNYILCDGIQGVAKYLDRSTLEIISEEYPDYKVYVEYVVVNNADRGGTEIFSRDYYGFLFDIKEGDAYLFNVKDENWQYINPNITGGRNYAIVAIADTVYQLAYGKHFYKNKMYWGHEP